MGASVVVGGVELDLLGVGWLGGRLGRGRRLGLELIRDGSSGRGRGGLGVAWRFGRGRGGLGFSGCSGGFGRGAWGVAWRFGRGRGGLVSPGASVVVVGAWVSPGASVVVAGGVGVVAWRLRSWSSGVGCRPAVAGWVDRTFCVRRCPAGRAVGRTEVRRARDRVVVDEVAVAVWTTGAGVDDEQCPAAAGSRTCRRP